MADDDCRHGYCQKDGRTLCSTNGDCPQDASHCSVTPTTTCASDRDCPPQTGSCLLTAGACHASSECPVAGKCKYTQSVCNNPGGSCPDVTVCRLHTDMACSSPADCPPTSSSGACSLGGTPHWGCLDNADCPSYRRCEATGDSCRDDTECPPPSLGYCSGNGRVCNNRNRTCPTGQSCLYPANPCVGGDNVCTKPPDTCVPKTDNRCEAAPNPCSVAENQCIVPPANACLPPASGTDVCVPSPQGTPGPIRMCRVAQTVCRRDADCPLAGDECGPATSRAIIAKRAVSAVVNRNHPMLNFGLMTFYQNGYFPYFLNTSGSTGLITIFAHINKIANSHCWDNHAGPDRTCRIDGINMTLRESGNSRYRVRTSPSTWVDVDVDWCGHTCEMPDDMGLGHFEGAYYQYTGTTGGNSTTMMVTPTYDGHDITVDGQNYSYYQPLDNYYNGGEPPPLEFPDCQGACSDTCGARWDTQLAPFLSTADAPAISENAAVAISRAMAPAADGGLLFYWSTPTGCALQNDRARTLNASAYHYMDAVKNGRPSEGIPRDPVACRENYILLITDGAANGPGDVGCDAAACAAANPASAGCECRSVLAAYHLHKDLGVKTFVVGFSGDVSAGAPRIINDNIARAGGTDSELDGVAPFAYLAQNENELGQALELVVYSAVKGSYSTAPTSTSAGTQQATTVAEGRYALDSRVDFPEWRGHLLAYNLSGAEPVLAWDAYQKLAVTNWWERRVYTWDGTNMVKIVVDPASKAVTNQTELAALGLGASAAEAEAVARWLLGDPVYKNPALLGAIINSTPIDVASPGDLSQPGGHAYFLQHQHRPHLVYVGSSDGMLHAFFLENTTVGGTTHLAGTEAFAFLPPDLMPTVRLQYSQGGQSPNPRSHIFGIANSPKAKTLCVQNCHDAATAVWKTLLIVPEGYGGSDTFMLDVSAPFAAGGLAEPPVRVEWHTGRVGSAASYDTLLGQTISLPAYFFHKTGGMDDYRVAFASGYPVTEGSTTQGRTVITASAASGAIVTTNAVAPAATCAQEYAALTDFAVARDFATGQDNKMVAGYVGDTSGQLHRFRLGGGITRAWDFTCDHPLHFSPTVVQLDRDSTTTSFAHAIFPVQVTNSNLDLATSALPPSKLVFWKEIVQTDDDGAITGVVKDTSWGSGGQIALTVGVDGQICGVTEMDDEGVVTCKTSMPATARPTSTPLGVLLRDASGFQVMTMWYVPAPDGCTRGQTYFTIHQMSGTGSVAQRVGAVVANEPVTAPVIIGGRIYVFGAMGAIDISGLTPDALTPGRAVPTDDLGRGHFRQLDWRELD